MQSHLKSISKQIDMNIDSSNLDSINSQNNRSDMDMNLSNFSNDSIKCCHYCKSVISNGDRKCKTCKVPYCSALCQVEDYQNHKMICLSAKQKSIVDPNWDMNHVATLKNDQIIQKQVNYYDEIWDTENFGNFAVNELDLYSLSAAYNYDCDSKFKEMISASSLTNEIYNMESEQYNSTPDHIVDRAYRTVNKQMRLEQDGNMKCTTQQIIDKFNTRSDYSNITSNFFNDNSIKEEYSRPYDYTSLLLRNKYAFHTEKEQLLTEPYKVIGLKNLGNTNSAIQCLNAIPEITNYFSSDAYKKHLNLNNPLGKEGRMANSFSRLINKMNNSFSSFHVPELFRKEFFEIAPQYAGIIQHDAQEALAYILDILHEDVNQVLVKPSIVNNDMNNDTIDSIGAKEYMENYLKRNISVVADLFAGQEKSTIICPKCDRILKQFPIFFSLSLPIPNSNNCRELFKCQYYQNLNSFNSEPLIISFKLSENATIMQLKDEVLKQINFNGSETTNCNELCVFLVKDNNFRATLNNASDLEGFKRDDLICIYKLIDSRNKERKIRNLKQIRLLFKLEKKDEQSEFDYRKQGLYRHPYIFDFEGSLTGEILHTTVGNAVSGLGEYFELRVTDRYGELCELGNIIVLNDSDKNNDCPNKNFCHGCLILNNEDIIEFSDPFITITCILKRKTGCFNDIMDNSKIGKKVIGDLLDVSLSDCLASFTSCELLDERDSWYCNQCKQHLRISKKMEIWNSPKVLVLSVKRFKFTQSGSIKINNFVDFPLKGLDVSLYFPTNSEKSRLPCMYDLFAVINHVGSSGFGHYTAMIKKENLWYHCNDDKVKIINEDQVVTKNAYVLFYRKL